jgi:lysozyme family protein
MPNIVELIATNQKRWDNMNLDQARQARFTKIAQDILAPANWARYVKISQATGVPPQVIGVIHYREADLNFGAQLAQGDPLGAVSKNVPSGRGPFFNHPADPPEQDAFYRGALDALIDCDPHAAKWTDWSPGGTCTLMEEYNGLGYARRGIPSAYIWSGTDQYVKGKYVRDGVFDPDEVDVQEGCAAILRCIMDINPSITFGKPVLLPPGPTPTEPMPKPAPAPTPAPGPDVETTQERLWQLLLHSIQSSSQGVSITLAEVQDIVRQVEAFSPILNAVASVIPGAAPWALVGMAFVGAVSNALTFIQQNENKSTPDAIVTLLQHLTPGQPNAALLGLAPPPTPQNVVSRPSLIQKELRKVFIFADSSHQYLAREELQGLSPEQLVIARNEIFARKGRYFKEDALRDYFSQFSWYQPHTWDVTLSPVEQGNVELIQSVEQSLAGSRHASGLDVR